MKHLYFMRHGLSVMNKKGLFSGRTDTPLAKEGVLQCQEAGRSLKGTPIDLIISSPMLRAFQSAKIVAKEIGYPETKILLNDLFMERDLGSLEGKDYIRGLTLNLHPGVEHSDNLIERAKQAIAFLNNQQANNILVVSHSSLGRALKHAINSGTEFKDIEGFINGNIVKLI